MKCVFERVGQSSKAPGWWHYRCIVCGLEGHSPHPAVVVDGVEKVIGPACAAGPRPVTPVARGVGTEIKKLLESLSITPDFCPGLCEQLRQEWDRNGIAWCKAHRDDVLIPRITEAYRKTDWLTVLRAAANAAATRDIALAVLPHLRPWLLVESAIEGLIEVALVRAEQA